MISVLIRSAPTPDSPFPFPDILVRGALIRSLFGCASSFLLGVEVVVWFLYGLKYRKRLKINYDNDDRRVRRGKSSQQLNRSRKVGPATIYGVRRKMPEKRELSLRAGSAGQRLYCNAFLTARHDEAIMPLGYAGCGGDGRGDVRKDNNAVRTRSGWSLLG